VRFILKLAATAAAAASLSLAAASVSGAAEPTSTITVIHGIPGADLGLAPDLPVDVLVNGELCALTDFSFTDVSPRLELPAGTYDLEVKVSDGECGGQTAVSAEDVAVPGGINATVVAHLDDAGAPTLSVFVNDLSATARYQHRVAVHHLANAPAVDVTATQVRQPAHPREFIRLEGVTNGQQGVEETWVGPYRFDIFPAGEDDAVFSAPATLIGGRYYGIYAVGSLATGTFTVIIDVQLTEGRS